MNYRITEKILCIPPYLSTTWDQVSSLKTEKDTLTNTLILEIYLIDGTAVIIPGLDISIIEVIFSSHVTYMEKKNKMLKENKSQNIPLPFLNSFGLSPEQLSQFTLRIGPIGRNMTTGLEGMESAMQHDPSKADSSNLPPEMLEQFSQIAKILTGGDLGSFPKPEPHCNCIHCQLSRAIHQEDSHAEDEKVPDEDLKFRDWQIRQTADNLYQVIHPLDPSEKYDVFLGSPIGCTCGESHCEHVKAVLLSDPH